MTTTKFTVALVVALAASAVLSGCAREAPAFESTSDLAYALTEAGVACDAQPAAAKGSLVADQATCVLPDGALDIYVFVSAQDRDDWLRVGAQLSSLAVGPNWVVGGKHGDTARVASALGGRVDPLE